MALNVNGLSIRDPRRFVVGFDFGTTYSAAAYCDVTDKESITTNDIIQVAEYRGTSRKNKKYLKEVASELWYCKPGRIYWGYAAQEQSIDQEQDGIHITFPKYLLDESEEIEQQRENLRDRLSEVFRDDPEREKENVEIILTDVIADYLYELFIHTKKQLNAKTKYRKYDEIRLAYTVPTAWPVVARLRMRNAVDSASKRAGFGCEATDQTFVITEPEAAAVYAQEWGSKNSYPPFEKSGEICMIVDAGGGTVDSQIYEVVGLAPLRLKEVLQGQGIQSGSTFLNSNFERWLRTKLKDQPVTATRQNDIANALIDFERRIKPDYEGTPDIGSYIIMRSWDVNAKNPDKMMITQSDYNAIFKPVLEPIGKLVESQLLRLSRIKKRLKSIVLVGGFAKSPVLLNYLEERLKHHAVGRDVEILRPDTDEASLAMGVVYQANHWREGPDRIMDSSFGIMISEEYDDKEPGHQNWKQEEHPLTKIPLIEDCMVWLVEAGQEIPPGGFSKLYNKASVPISRDETEDQVIEVQLFSSRNTESHYPYDHPKNRNKACAAVGVVQFDLKMEEIISGSRKSRKPGSNNTMKRFNNTIKNPQNRPLPSRSSTRNRIPSKKALSAKKAISQRKGTTTSGGSQSSKTSESSCYNVEYGFEIVVDAMRLKFQLYYPRDSDKPISESELDIGYLLKPDAEWRTDPTS